MMLDDADLARLKEIATHRRWPTEGEALVQGIRDVSERYNDPASESFRRLGPEALAARLLFWFPRDVPKAAAAVRELVRYGDLKPGDAPLKVLDLGAGLGAATFGLQRALGVPIAATLVDTDEKALTIAGEILGSHAKLRTGDLARVEGGPWDVIIAMQVLSELDRDAPAEIRLEKHAALVARWVRALAPNGTLVLIEPALRDRARHLHAIPLPPGANVYAPCLHNKLCAIPERDWCHEDLPIDLPPTLVPLARAAGLRFERLTFAYRLIRRDGATLRRHLGDAPCARIVGVPPRTKGRFDRVACGDDGVVRRVIRLDRHETETNAGFNDLARGDLVDALPDRIGADLAIRTRS